MRQPAVIPVVFAICLLGLASGCGKGEQERGEDVSARSGEGGDSDPLSLFMKSIKAYNEQDMSSLIQMFDPTLQWNHKTAAKIEVRGRAALANLFMQEKNMFPDREVALRRVIVQGSDLVAQMVARATHRGSAHGIKPTGKKVSWEFGYFTTVSNGKIKRTSVYFNPISILRQMGVVSVPNVNVPAWPEKMETIRGSQSQDNENRVKTFYALLGSESLEHIGEFVTPKAELCDRTASATLEGVDAIKEYFEKIRNDFGKLSYDIERVLSADNHVAVQAVRHGVYEMALAGSDKKETKEVELSEMHIFRFNDGKIDGLDFYIDEMQIYKQFGYSMAEAVAMLSEGKEAGADAGPEKSGNTQQTAEHALEKKADLKPSASESPDLKKVKKSDVPIVEGESPF